MAVLPESAAGQLVHRQALAVERPGPGVGDAELAAQQVGLAGVRRHPGMHAEPGRGRAGQPGRRVEVGQVEPGLGEGLAGERGQRRRTLAAHAFLGDHLEGNALERAIGSERQAHLLGVELATERRAQLHGKWGDGAEFGVAPNLRLADLAAQLLEAVGTGGVGIAGRDLIEGQ